MIAALVTAVLAEPMHAITPDDLFTLERAEELAVDARGRRVAWIRARWDEASGTRKRDVWMSDTRTGAATRLTFTDGNEHDLRWSRDGRWLYYLRGDDAGKQRVWRRSPDVADEVPVSPAGLDVQDYALSADALWLIAERKAPVDDAFSALRKAHGDVRYGHHERRLSTLHRLDLQSWRDREVQALDATAYELAVTPNGRYVAALTAPDTPLMLREGWSEVWVWDVAAGARVAIDDTLWRASAPSPYGWLTGLSWSSDGLALAFHVDFDGYPGETYVAELAAGQARVWALPRPGEVTTTDDRLAWVPDRRELCMIAADRARQRVLCVDDVRAGTFGRQRMFPDGNVVVHDFGFSGDGRDVVADVATPTSFSELYRLPGRGLALPVRVTDLNPHTDDWRLPTLSVVSWTAPDGREVEGILELPYGHDPAEGPIPTYVVIHGGPTSHARFERQLRPMGEGWMASEGVALFMPNYRGSTSFGDAFLTDLVGRENDVEVADILAGVDALVARGIADPERLAVGGWSNGGYLTGAAITATDRFKAAILGAGVVDMTLQWALEDTPGHVINFMKGQPWEVGEHYLAASPLYDVGAIRTPTLIQFGADDPRVPPAHGQALFRALHHYTDVPVELMLFPNAGHGLGTMKQLRTKQAWDVAWLKRFLLGVDDAE